MSTHDNIAIYMVSTPLHLYCASAIAINERDDFTNILIFIDQPDTENNIYHQSVINWESSPFDSVFLFEGRLKGALNKWKSRQQIFSKITDIVKRYPADEIYVGNDRRIEFQYAMHIASQNKEVLGVYLDEGIFSYLGRKSSGSFSDKYIDQSIKKLSYGKWWKNPPTVGGSSWINIVYAAFPEHIHPLLQGKDVRQLSGNYFNHPSIKELSGHILKHTHITPEQLSSINILLTLPHESLAKDDDEYQQHLKHIIEQLKATNNTVAYKPHPRDISGWYHIFDDQSVLALPQKANFESLLPLLNKVTLIADMSSTLLIAKWLRPELNIIAITQANSQSQTASFEQLYQKIGIRTITSPELHNEFNH